MDFNFSGGFCFHLMQDLGPNHNANGTVNASSTTLNTTFNTTSQNDIMEGEMNRTAGEPPALAKSKPKRRKLVPIKKLGQEPSDRDSHSSFFRLKRGVGADSDDEKNERKVQRMEEVKHDVKNEVKNELIIVSEEVSSGIKTMPENSATEVKLPNTVNGPHNITGTDVECSPLISTNPSPIVEVISDEDDDLVEVSRIDEPAVDQDEYSSDQAVEESIVKSPSDQDDDLNDLDPELRARIEQRKRQLAAQSRTAFTVYLTMSSKLPGIDGEPLQLHIQSSDTFKGLKGYYVDNMVRALNCAQGSPEYVTLHECIFVWNGIQLFEFSTPSSLNVAETNPHMEISVTSPEDFRQSRKNFLKTLEEEESDDDLIRAVQTSYDEENDRVAQEAEEGPKYFKIKLQGEGGPVLEVAVNAESKIRKLADYYLQKRGLPLDTKITLEFDDEQLDMNASVADTELEEDYMVDVIL